MIADNPYDLCKNVDFSSSCLPLVTFKSFSFFVFFVFSPPAVLLGPLCQASPQDFPLFPLPKPENNTAHTHLCLSICYYFLRRLSYATVHFLPLVEV